MLDLIKGAAEQGTRPPWHDRLRAHCPHDVLTPVLVGLRQGFARVGAVVGELACRP